MLYGSYDTGWIVQVGQQILDKGLLSHDPFSWTHSGIRYVAYQWLFAASLAQIFRWGSLWLVGLVCCLGAGILILFALPRVWVSKGVPLSVALAFLALSLTPHWFNARPQLCSFFFTLLFITVLERFRQSKSTAKLWLFSLPPLTMLWVNLHSFWFVGLLCIAVYCAADWWRCKHVSLPLALCLVACSAATMVNPYGAGLLSYLTTFIDSSQYMNIWELKPWFTCEQFSWTILFVPLCVYLLWMGRTKVPAEGFILSAIAIVAALCMRRFEPMAVIMSWTYLGLALSEINWSQLQKGIRLHLHPAIHFGLALAVPVVGWFSYYPSILSASMLYTDNSYPLLALVQSHVGAQDRLFNDPVTGSWLIALGRVPVFIDSRLDMYPKQFVTDTNNCLDGQSGWSKLLDNWRVTQIVTRDDVVLSQQLLKSDDWLLVIDDGLLNWWVRNTPQAVATLDSWQLSDEQLNQSGLPPYMVRQTSESRCVRYLQLARRYLSENKPQQALFECGKGLTLMPHCAALQQQTQLCMAALTGRNPL